MHLSVLTSAMKKNGSQSLRNTLGWRDPTGVILIESKYAWRDKMFTVVSSAKTQYSISSEFKNNYFSQDLDGNKIKAVEDVGNRRNMKRRKWQAPFGLRWMHTACLWTVGVPSENGYGCLVSALRRARPGAWVFVGVWEARGGCMSPLPCSALLYSFAYIFLSSFNRTHMVLWPRL